MTLSSNPLSHTCIQTLLDSFTPGHRNNTEANTDNLIQQNNKTDSTLDYHSSKPKLPRQPYSFSINLQRSIRNGTEVGFLQAGLSCMFVCIHSRLVLMIERLIHHERSKLAKSSDGNTAPTLTLRCFLTVPWNYSPT